MNVKTNPDNGFHQVSLLIFEIAKSGGGKNNNYLLGAFL